MSTFVLFFVFFSPDGRPQWEVEAKIIREKSQGVSEVMLFELYTKGKKTVSCKIILICNFQNQNNIHMDENRYCLRQQCINETLLAAGRSLTA